MLKVKVFRDNFSCIRTVKQHRDSHSTDEVFGKVTKLNPKTAGVLVGEQQ